MSLLKSSNSGNHNGSLTDNRTRRKLAIRLRHSPGFSVIFVLFIWEGFDFSGRDTFYHVASRLYLYQEKDAACKQIFAVNKGSEMFLECFEKVLRREISKMGYIEAAVAGSCFPSADLVTDYIIKVASLLKDSMADLDHAELDNMAKILLDQPFRVA